MIFSVLRDSNINGWFGAMQRYQHDAGFYGPKRSRRAILHSLGINPDAKIPEEDFETLSFLGYHPPTVYSGISGEELFHVPCGGLTLKVEQVQERHLNPESKNGGLTAFFMVKICGAEDECRHVVTAPDKKSLDIYIQKASAWPIHDFDPWNGPILPWLEKS